MSRARSSDPVRLPQPEPRHEPIWVDCTSCGRRMDIQPAPAGYQTGTSTLEAYERSMAHEGRPLCWTCCSKRSVPQLPGRG